MAEKKQTDVPEKNEQTVLGGEKTAPDNPAKTPAPKEKAPAPDVGGADRPVPEGRDEKAAAPPAPENKSKLIGIDFPSGKKIVVEETAKTPKPPGKAAPAQKKPGRDKQAGKPADKAQKPD